MWKQGQTGYILLYIFTISIHYLGIWNLHSLSKKNTKQHLIHSPISRNEWRNHFSNNSVRSILIVSSHVIIRVWEGNISIILFCNNSIKLFSRFSFSSSLHSKYHACVRISFEYFVQINSISSHTKDLIIYAIQLICWVK